MANMKLLERPHCGAHVKTVNDILDGAGAGDQGPTGL